MLCKNYRKRIAAAHGRGHLLNGSALFIKDGVISAAPPGRKRMIDDDGNIGNDDTRKFLQNFADRYAAWVKKLA